jgi:hypothetical protein
MTDVEGGDYVQSESGPASQRKSHTFLGICDMRIGTYFVNVMNITLILIGILVAAIRGPLFWKSLWGSFGRGLPGLFLSSVGIYGAHSFELWAMYVATGGFIVAFIIDIILFDWAGLIITAIILYPHCYLTYEIRSGVMTKDTYATEEYVIEGGRDFVDKANAYLSPTVAAT